MRFSPIALHRFGPLVILLCLFAGTSACSLLRDDTAEPLVDYVDSVQWVLGDPTASCGTSSPGHCVSTLRTEYKWTSGRTTYGDYLCMKCSAGSAIGQLGGGTTILFADSNLPVPTNIRIPAHRPTPGLVLWTRRNGVNSTATDNICRRYGVSDLQGPRLQNLNDYLNALVRYYGASAGLDATRNHPRDVCLLVSDEVPSTEVDSSGRTAYVAGRISCEAGSLASARNCRYQVKLYARAFSLTNSCLNAVYNTTAHEFKHILQSIAL